jgi:hypothetical protein
MKSLLHARVIRVWSLQHRIKFKTSCILSLTMSCLQGSQQGTLSKSEKSLGPWRKPQMHGSQCLSGQSSLLSLLICH